MGCWYIINVQQKKLAFKKYLQTKTLDTEIEYKHRRAIANREIRKRHHKSWEQFLSHLESDIYKIKPNKFKLLKHMNIDIKESANINPRPSKAAFLHYYKELWTNNSLQENYWNRDDVDDKITMEELKEELKKQKMENQLAKIIWIPNFINMQETHFMRDY